MEGKDHPTAAAPFPPAISHLPQPSNKGPRATRLEKDAKAQEKQVGCQKADISIQGMTSPQAAPCQQMPARQQVTKGDIVFMGKMA